MIKNVEYRGNNIRDNEVDKIIDYIVVMNSIRQ